MALSLVIPTLRVGNKLNEFLETVEGQYDELIIVDDKIDNLAVKINKGLRKSTGDYIAVANDDIKMTQGILKDLCITGQVVSPRVVGGLDKTFHAHLWVMPRDVYENSVGVVKGWSDYGRPGYFEGFYRFYWDDSDYYMKLRNNGFIPVKNENVIINHDHPGWTLGTFTNNSNAESFNRDLFIKRWGSESIQIVE